MWLPYCRHTDRWPASRPRIPLQIPSPASTRHWVLAVTLLLATRWQCAVWAGRPLTLTGLKTSLLLPWTVMSGPLMAVFIWIRLASSRATMSWSLRDRDHCNCNTQPNVHHQTDSPRLVLCLGQTHVHRYWFRFKVQSYFEGLTLGLISTSTSLSQLSQGTGLVTYRWTQILSE